MNDIRREERELRKEETKAMTEMIGKVVKEETEKRLAKEKEATQDPKDKPVPKPGEDPKNPGKPAPKPAIPAAKAPLPAAGATKGTDPAQQTVKNPEPPSSNKPPAPKKNPA